MLRIERFTSSWHPELVYEACLDNAVFALPKCDSCIRMHYPPRVMCPHCGSDALSWTECSGTGTVYSASTISTRDGGQYSVVLVDLDEGPRLMSNVVDSMGSETADIAIGDRVRVRIESRDGRALPLFERAGAA